MSAAYNPNRPPDDAMIAALAERFMVDPCVVIAWLKQMDHKAATERIAERFVPLTL